MVVLGLSEGVLLLVLNFYITVSHCKQGCLTKFVAKLNVVGNFLPTFLNIALFCISYALT